MKNDLANFSSSADVRPRTKRSWRSLTATTVVAATLFSGCSLFEDAPKEVSIEDAAANVEKETSGATGATSDGAVGEWVIDNETGEFDFESATGTFAGFRVKEELASIGSTTAVGRTGDVTGSITIGDKGLEAGTFTVDMTTITTDQKMRDSRVQSALETTQFPEATFEVTSPTAFDIGVEPDVTVKVEAPGTLTIHGVSKDVAFPLEAKLVGSTVVVVGSLDISLSDFGVTAPTAPAVLSVSDTATIEFNLLFKRA